MPDRLVVEYLFVVDPSNGFGHDIKSFHSLMQSLANVRLGNKKIYYKSLEIKYQVDFGQIKNEHKNFFHVKFICFSPERLDDFEKFTRNVRVLLSKVSLRQPEEIWNDISLYYAQKAYPFIFTIENLMRKIITKFMITKIGLKWIEKNIPDGVTRSVRRKNRDRQDLHNLIYETDFIKLSNFLFDPYSFYEIEEFYDFIEANKNHQAIRTSEMEKYLPKSNWQRHFSKVVDCQDVYLKKRWKELYGFRCRVAHNNVFTKSDFARTAKLVGEIQPILEKALSKLENVQMTKEEKEEVKYSISYLVVEDKLAKNATFLSRKTVTDYLQQADDALTDRFEILKEFILSLGEDVQMNVRKHYIAFKRTHNFVCAEIHPQTGKIKLHIKADLDEIELEEGFSRNVQGIGHYGTGDLELSIYTDHDLEKAKQYIISSYETN